MGAATQSRVGNELASDSERQYPFPDPGLAVDPPIVSRHPDDVAYVAAEEGYRLRVRFFDGTAGIVEMREMIFAERAGVFAALKDPTEFEKVGIGFGAVMWANDLALAPDVMYDEFKKHGKWVLD